MHTSKIPNPIKAKEENSLMKLHIRTYDVGESFFKEARKKNDILSFFWSAPLVINI